MKISEEKFNKFYNLLLICIISTIVFGKISYYFIASFALFNLIFFKPLKFDKTSLKLAFYVAIPLLFEIVFFWNNEYFSEGLKSIEKYTSILVFIFFIIGHYKRVDFKFVLKKYSIIMPYIILLMLLRFIFFFPEFKKYINGIDLVESGYVFTNSFGVHAPVLNMHLSFVGIVLLWITIDSYIKKKNKMEIIFLIATIILNFFLILIINTRIALFNFFLCAALVLYFEFKKVIPLKKVLISMFSILLILISVIFVYTLKNPYMIKKYSTVTFAHHDKIGKLDEIENPHINVFNSLVTRLSIWKSAIELSKENPIIGVGGSDGKEALISYYKRTNQKFLAEYQFQTHNQFLNYLVKFGIIGLIFTFIYFFNILNLAVKLESTVVFSFFLIFLISNLTDDFLNRFDGIAYSAFWISLFSSELIKENKN